MRLTFVLRREVFCDCGADGGRSADEDYGDSHCCISGAWSVKLKGLFLGYGYLWTLMIH